MAEKSGKVLDCVFEDDWINPISKKTIYYHRISIDNGDVGKVGSLEMNSSRFKKGALIEYTIDENNKIKVTQSSNDDKKFAKNQVLKDGVVVLKGGAKSRRHDEFLGFVWGYAKDLVIAGKNMDDVRKMPEIAQYLYNEVGKMLNQDNLPQSSVSESQEFIKDKSQKHEELVIKSEIKQKNLSRSNKNSIDNEFANMKRETRLDIDQPIQPISDWFKDDDELK